MTDEQQTTTITVPTVSGTAAAEGSDRLEELRAKYAITDEDMDGLFNSMIAVYIRGRMVYGDRQPSVCSLAGSCCSTGEQEP